MPAPTRPARSVPRSASDSGVVRSANGASTGRASRPTVIRSIAPGKPEFQINQRLAPAAGGAALPGDDRSSQMRSAIGALAGVAVAGKEVIDRLSERWCLAPRSAEGNTASAVDQVDRGGQSAVCALHRPPEVVDQHRPGDAFLAPVRAGVIKLLLIRAVSAVPLARMSLTNDHLDEPHPVAVPPMQLAHRGHAAARDRAGVTDKVEQHRLPPQIAQPHPLPVGGQQVKLRCVTARRQASAEQLGDHVPHPEVPKVEVLDRVEQLDQPLRSPVCVTVDRKRRSGGLGNSP